jgi:hypothetical protein
VRTSDIRCSTADGRLLATRSVRPMGVTRIARPTGRDGIARRLRGPNMAPCRVTRLRSRFSSRDRTVMAA